MLPTETNGTKPPIFSIALVARIVYLLHAASILIGIVTGASMLGAFLFGWPSLAAVALNYLLRSEAQGTVLESHFRWQIQTFWVAMAWGAFVCVLGFMLLPLFGAGFAVWYFGFIVMGLWVGYRIVRGWLRLADGLGMQGLL